MLWSCCDRAVTHSGLAGSASAQPPLGAPPPQTTKALQRKLRNCNFEMCRKSPRMLPHAYEPTRMDVAVEHTPEKVGGTDAAAAAAAGRISC